MKKLPSIPQAKVRQQGENPVNPTGAGSSLGHPWEQHRGQGAGKYGNGRVTITGRGPVAVASPTEPLWNMQGPGPPVLSDLGHPLVQEEQKTPLCARAAPGLWTPGKVSPGPAGAKQTAGTCELFLDFSVPCPAEEAHTLPDPVLPPRFNLVGGVLEHQVPEGPGCCPLHVLVLAAEQLHELGNAPQPIDLARRDMGHEHGAQGQTRDRHLP